MKLLFTDLDGTLLNDDKTISAENLAAIRRAAEKGHLTVINTGRSFSSAEPFIRQLASVLPDCYASTYNGGLIYDYTRQKTIYKRTIPIPYVKYIFQQAEKFHLHCQTYEKDYVLALRNRFELEQYHDHTKLDVHVDPHFLEHFTNEPVKVLTSCLDNRELHEAYRRSMEEWAKGKVSLFFSSDYYLEHVPEGVSKGNAIQVLCDHLHVPLSETVAAGDAENDIAMLAAAGTGVCMINGTRQTKASADYITLHDNNHGGIAEIIEKFIEF